MNGDISQKREWERSESRIVRPFRFSEGLFARCAIRLRPQDDFEEGAVLQTVKLNPEDVAPELRLDFHLEGIEEVVGLSLNDLEVMVSVEDRILKQTLVPYREGVRDCAGETVALPPARMKGISWAEEMRVSLALVLRGDREVEVGRASLAGHWLAKKTFSISRSKDTANFTIDVVPPEWFVKRGLPGDTTYLVEVFGTDLNQPCDRLGELVRVSLNESVNAVLARAEDSTVGRALIRGIYSDVVATVLSVGFSSYKGEELLAGGVLKVVSDKLARSTGAKINDIVRRAKEPGASELRALIQSEAGLTKAMVSANLRGA
jgi:hypothetical protein